MRKLVLMTLVMAALTVAALAGGCRTSFLCDEAGSGRCAQPDEAAKGADDAPILIEEFSEFQCPYCRRVQPTLAELHRRYPGKIRHVFRHFPLQFHGRALPAAKAAVAAQRQGKFWPYHDLLFEQGWKLSDEDLLIHARRLELDIERFQQDIAAPGTAAVVARDTERGRELGVRGVPAFFVNGRLISGAQPVETFVEIIEEELSEAAP